MAFRFRLEAVLRYREGVEHAEEAVLYGIVREIAVAESELKQVDTRQGRIREQMESELANPLPAIHLLEIAEREAELKKLAEELRSRLRRLESQRLQQMVKYQTAHQDRKMISELHDQQRQAYQLEQRRQEQKTLDDLFLARRQALD